MMKVKLILPVQGYRHAYREFHRWRSIARGARSKPELRARLRHVAYAGGWKKCERLWDAVIRARRLGRMLPLLESILHGFGRLREDRAPSARSRLRRAS